MEGPDLTILFEQFMNSFDAFARMETEWPVFHSGEEFFGLDHLPIKKYIEVFNTMVFLIFKVFIFFTCLGVAICI